MKRDAWIVLSQSFSNVLSQVSEMLRAEKLEHKLDYNRRSPVHLVVFTPDGRTLSLGVTFSADNTNRRRRDFINRAIRDHRARTDIRIYLEVLTNKTTYQIGRIASRIMTVIRELVHRWRQFGAYDLAAFRIPPSGGWEPMRRLFEEPLEVQFQRAHDQDRSSPKLSTE